MASPAQKYRFNGLPELTAENVEQLDEMLEDLYTYLTQSPLGTGDAAFDFSELADTGLLYLDADEALASFGTTGLVYVDSADLPQALSTVGSVYINTSGVPAALSAATGNALISGGAGAVPSFGKIGLTTHVTGTLPIANGGTNNTTFNSGSVMYFDGTKIAEDNSGIFFDAGNNRLGVGATNPTEVITATAATSAIIGTHFTDTSNFCAFRLYEGTTLSGTLQFVGSTFATVGRRNNLELFNMHASGDITLHVAGSTTPSVTLTETGAFRIAALTTGSVLFSGASGHVTQDNSNLFWDDTNNRLGIGTASPGVSLEVITASADPDNNEILKTRHTTQATGWVYGQAGTGATPLGLVAGDAFQYDNGGAKKFGIRTIGTGSANFLIGSGGKVGISVISGGQVPTAATPLHIEYDQGAALFRQERVGGAQANVWDTFITSSPVSGAGLSDGSLTFMNVGAAADFAVTTESTTAAPNFVIRKTSGIVAIGTRSFPSTGTYSLIFGDGTVPATMGSNTAGLYANDVSGTVNMYAINEAGESTRLSFPAPQTYTESNVTTDRAFDANATTLDEIADVVGTLIVDLRARGIVA